MDAFTTKKKAGSKVQRTRYSVKFKQQALLRAVKDGVPVAARELGLEPAKLYARRSTAHQQGHTDETQRLMQSETARLKRDLAGLEEENAPLPGGLGYLPPTLRADPGMPAA